MIGFGVMEVLGALWMGWALRTSTEASPRAVAGAAN
jgi:hypothetical protein